MHRPDEMGKLPLETTYIYGLALYFSLIFFILVCTEMVTLFINSVIKLLQNVLIMLL